jgi:geranylgeranyl diphosphate synthase, type I
MATEPAFTGSTFDASLVERTDQVLRDVLDDAAGEIGAADPQATLLVEEIRRVIFAGGKRLRPTCCYWGFRAAGGVDGAPIVRAGAAVELLHTMALIHDDLIDDAEERRGVPASRRRMADEAEERGWTDPARFGTAAALLAGDLAAVLADAVLATSGFDADALRRAAVPFTRMRFEMAAGQLLDVAGLGREPSQVRPAARLKGGSYTVEGPLEVGAALAGADVRVRSALGAFGRPLGQAFQLRDDLLDADAAASVSPALVNELIEEARRALRDAGLSDEASAALEQLADRLVMP